jgi:hypothetical protein
MSLQRIVMISTLLCPHLINSPKVARDGERDNSKFVEATFPYHLYTLYAYNVYYVK